MSFSGCEYKILWPLSDVITFGAMTSVFGYDGLTLEYEVLGNGKKALFAFHGFGSSAELFRELETSLGKTYTIYSFNLPFHGLSKLDHESSALGIYPDLLKVYFKNFLWHIHATYFSVAGYSLGGKIALELVILFPEEVKEIFLFAPDGIKVSPWYGFVTKTILGKWIYKRLMLHPGRYQRIINVLEKIRIVHPRTASFVRASLDTEEKRLLVYNTWQCFRHIEPDIRQFQNIVNRKRLQIYLFFGKYDKVIPPGIGKKFVRGLRNKKSLHVVEAGHQLVNEKLNAEIEKILSE